MMRCLASDSKLEGTVDVVTTGTQSEVCPVSGGLGEPVIPPTENNLLHRVADLSSLNKAWRIVRASALSSQSSKIVTLAKKFDQDSIVNLRAIESSLKEGSFIFEGVFARLLPREGKAPRPLAVAPIASRIVQRAILDIIWGNKRIKAIVKEPETHNSFGGIQDESTKKAITELCKCVQSGYNYYITSDIKDFFQKINKHDVHNTIFQCLDDNSINSLIERAVQCEILNTSSNQVKKYINLFPKGDVGVIQGCCLSPLYGNVYLHNFDSIINSIKNIRCLRYIDDFIIIGKRERSVHKAFKKAIDILNKKVLDAYTLEEKDTKASFGDIRKLPINFLGCSIAKGQVRPQKKAKESLCKKIDSYISNSISYMIQSKGCYLTEYNYINTILKINNTLKGWGGAFSFCTDKEFFKRLDAEIMQKISHYHSEFKKISLLVKGIQDRQRLFGLHMLVDCIKQE
ncbi:MAG: reverse transcriptase/maturase family protein [Desulfovibrio sp.]|nr:reverse transcriptase/maturase family protein [Desulfovibrio sp.]